MKSRGFLTLSLLTLVGAGSAVAQQPQKPLSPPGMAQAMVGGSWSEPDAKGARKYTPGKWIEVEYSRPMLRGRTDIFGAGADYGKAVNGGAPVWRAGANKTTLLTTEATLEIGGKKVAPGTYDVFVELKEGGWTFILSTQPYQEKWDREEKVKIFGAYGYDLKFDVVRAPMKMMTPKVSVEQFTIAFVDVTDKGGKLAMAWEKTVALVPFTVVP
jgi:hypothetical protein